jgi:hypothetical protein
MDGFPARFYQRNWGTLKEEVINAVKLFFVTGQMPDGVNDTAIVLIPKHDQPETLKDFRPISLCTVMYKVIAKCLVNRMRPMLDKIISVNQSAFVPGRLIIDNAQTKKPWWGRIQGHAPVQSSTVGPSSLETTAVP